MLVRIILGLVVIALALAGYVGVNAARLAGVFDTLEPKLVEQCARIDIAPGTEDVTFDRASGLAYVSADDRRASWEGEEGPGGIWRLDPADPSSLELVTVDAPADFHPHGISLWTGPDGARRLFVVSHPNDGREVVEIFDIAADGALAHAESVSFPEMYSPNDLVAVGPDSFYVTNDQRHEGGFMGLLESYFAVPMTSLAYYDGESGRTVVSGLSYANGVNVSADGRHVYVAEILRRAVGVYERDPETAELRRIARHGVGTAPDNIEIGPEGDLWIGAHPRIFDFVAHAEDENQIAPSHVVRLDPETGEVETVLVSLDGELSASASAAVHDGRLLVGAVFDGHILSCPLEG